MEEIISCSRCGCTYIKNSPSDRIIHGYRHKKILTYNTRHADGTLWLTYTFEEDRERETKTAFDVLYTEGATLEQKTDAALRLFQVHWINSFESVLFNKSLPKTLETHPDFPSYILISIETNKYEQNILTSEILDYLVYWAKLKGGKIKGSHRKRQLTLNLCYTDSVPI